MIVSERMVIPPSHWDGNTARGRQRMKDLQVLSRILLRSVPDAVLCEMLALPPGPWETLLEHSPHAAKWQELASILAALGPDYTRTQHCDSIDRACRFMYGPIVKSKSDVGPNPTS